MTAEKKTNGQKKPNGIIDPYQRQINYLRISVTDHCNLNCAYCSVGTVPRLRHDEVLSYEEIERVVRIAVEMGIDKVRLTGGEPLMRPDFPRLVKMLSAIDGLNDISATTNGILLKRFAAELKEAGLDRVNISLDTLKSDRYTQITRNGKLKDVLEGIEAAHQAGLEPVKINMVVMKGTNDDEIVDFARKTIDEGWNVRYIEFMPIGDSNGGVSETFSSKDILEQIQVLGKLEPWKGPIGNGPARYYRFPGASGTVGFITAMTEHFCGTCNRLRITSDGQLRPCLLADDEIDLKAALRRGSTDDEVREVIQQAVSMKREHHHLSGTIAPEKATKPMCQIGG